MVAYRSRRVTIYCGLGILALLIFGLFLYNESTDIYSLSRHIFKGGESFSKTDTSFFINVSFARKVQTDRVVQIHKTCAKYRQLMTSQGYRNHNPVYFAAPKYNLSFCKIGKIASTFLAQLFLILHREGDIINDAITKPRQDIHALADKYVRRGVKNSMCNQTRMVVSTRNPYTRLFSAYIDRIFVPSTTYVYLLTAQRKVDDRKCKSQFTFSEFLTYVLETTKLGIYNYHWSPVFYLCKPCEINPAIVFKQETFNQDVHYVIKQTRLEPYKNDVLSKIMQAQANSTGFLLIHDVMDFVTTNNLRKTLDCQTWEQVTHRLWRTLQIQGCVSQKAAFPSDLYETKEDFKNSDLFRRALVQARSKFPLSKAERSIQRRSAMNMFYSKVDPKIIESIKEVYRVDFEMFGYSFELPTV